MSSEQQESDWRVVAEFPQYDVNVSGQIRKKSTGNIVPVYDNGTVKLGRGITRSAAKIHRRAFPPSTDSDEMWKQCINQPAYAVSSLGNVKNLASGKCLATHLKKGYSRVGLESQTEGRSTLYVHRLVAEAFLGSAPTPKHDVNHKNGVKVDNCVKNLEWTSRQKKSNTHMIQDCERI